MERSGVKRTVAVEARFVPKLVISCGCMIFVQGLQNREYVARVRDREGYTVFVEVCLVARDGRVLLSEGCNILPRESLKSLPLMWPRGEIFVLCTVCVSTWP